MIPLLLLIAAAAPARIAGIEALAAQDVRVATIAYRLARGGAGSASDRLCTGRISLPGLVVQDLAQYSPRERLAARAALGLVDAVTVVAVVPTSSAQTAGLQPGDVIAAVDGVTIDATTAYDGYARLQQSEDLIEAAMGRGSAVLLVRRSGRAIGTTYAAESGCASRVQIVPGGKFNAEADGRYVQVAQAMVAFAGDDDTLAVLIAHEMAHNILMHQARHTPAKQAEYQADRLGVWLVARAGYATGGVVPFWTRLGRKTGLGILSDGTHPRWRPRIAAVARAVVEVEGQRARGEPLVPPQQSPSQAAKPR